MTQSDNHRSNEESNQDTFVEMDDNSDNLDDSLFQAIELTKIYGDNIALNAINFSTSTKALGILGPNGCGKSTFLKLLLNLIQPSKGSVSLNVDVKDIRVISDYPILPGEMTIDEWMELLEKFHGKLIQDIDVQERLNLQGSWKISDLSAGQYRKAALLPAFFGNPELIILDEPTNFLDIVTREFVLQLLSKQIKDRGSKVIIASHRIDEIRLLADQAIILKNGAMIKTIDLYKHPVRGYEIVVEQEEQFSEIILHHDINFKKSEVNGRNVFELPNLPKIWDLIFDFTKHRGTVVSMKSIDELDKNIEELLK